MAAVVACGGVRSIPYVAEAMDSEEQHRHDVVFVAQGTRIPALRDACAKRRHATAARPNPPTTTINATSCPASGRATEGAPAWRRSEVLGMMLGGMHSTVDVDTLAPIPCANAASFRAVLEFVHGNIVLVLRSPSLPR